MKSLVQFILESQSKPTVQWMKEHYKKYNKELFNNELPSDIRLGLIDKKTDALGWQGFDGTYWMFKTYMVDDMYAMLIPNSSTTYKIGRNKRFPDPSTMDRVKDINMLKPFIEMNPKYQFSDFQKEDTLIHEMIHLWVHRNGLSPKRSHGKEFKRKCDEVRAKAKKLYGIEYDLEIYAKKHTEEDKSYQMAKDVEARVTDELKKAAKRGGGVWSIYAKYDLNKIKTPRLIRFRNRFMFCTKRRLEIILNQVAKTDGVIEVWVSPIAYEKMCSTYGMFPTVNNYNRFWDVVQGDYDEKYLLENAQEVLNSKEVKTYENLINEGLGSKIKEWLKKIMGVFFKVTKDTPASEINVEDMFNVAEEVEETSEEIKGTKENEDKAINL